MLLIAHLSFLHVLRKRLIKPELLDHAPPEEARRNLADLVHINQKFGGHAAIRYIMSQVATQSDKFTLLDIGAASGDTAQLVKRLYSDACVVNLDRSSVNIRDAPPPRLVADAFRLPFRSESFDFVFCSLFLHHFTDDQIVELLGRFYETARRALLVCDLERHILPYWFLPASKFLFGWEHITLHDGPVSVRAAFRPAELAALARRAGIQGARVAVHRPAFRVSLIAMKGWARGPVGTRRTMPTGGAR